MEDDFERLKNTPQYWLNKSSDLRAAVAAVWHSRTPEVGKKIVDSLQLGQGFDIGVATSGVFPMLCGLSLELLLKAICVRRGLAIETHHNLVRHAEIAGVSVTEPERDLLEIYSGAAWWSGKYPVPKQSVQYEKHMALIEKRLFSVVSRTENLVIKRPNGEMNWEAFNNLWLTFYEHYSAARDC